METIEVSLWLQITSNVLIHRASSTKINRMYSYSIPERLSYKFFNMNGYSKLNGFIIIVCIYSPQKKTRDKIDGFVKRWIYLNFI